MLLAFGLATRLAAIPLLIFDAGDPVRIPGAGSTSLLGRAVRLVHRHGGGADFLDRLLTSGLASSALPLVKPWAGCTLR